MFMTASIIAAVFAGGSPKVENPIVVLADEVRQSDRIQVTAFITAILEAEPENIFFQRRTKYTITNTKTIRHLATMIRAKADANTRKTRIGDVSGQLIYVEIRGYAKNSDEPLWEATVYDSQLMFDWSGARFWVELPPATGAGERSELYNRLSDMNFRFEDEARPSEKK